MEGKGYLEWLTFRESIWTSVRPSLGKYRFSTHISILSLSITFCSYSLYKLRALIGLGELQYINSLVINSLSVQVLESGVPEEETSISSKSFYTFHSWVGMFTILAFLAQVQTSSSTLNLVDITCSRGRKLPV